MAQRPVGAAEHKETSLRFCAGVLTLSSFSFISFRSPCLQTKRWLSSLTTSIPLTEPHWYFETSPLQERERKLRILKSNAGNALELYAQEAEQDTERRA